MTKRLSDPCKAGFADAAAQVVVGQQGVHDVEKLHREAFAGLRHDWLAVWDLLVTHWAVQLHHLLCELVTQQHTILFHFSWIFHCSNSNTNFNSGDGIEQ